MKRFELVTAIPAPRERTWQALVGLAAWAEWNWLVPYGAGEVRPGNSLDLRIRGLDGRPRPFRPVVVSVEPPSRLVLAASVCKPKLLYMVHSFTIEPTAAGASLLRQRWDATGVLAFLAWPLIRRGMARFARFGSDLACCVAVREPTIC